MADVGMASEFAYRIEHALHSRGPSTDLFLASFGACRRQGQIGSDGGAGKVSARRVFRHLQIGTWPRRSPSACSEMFIKKTALGPNDDGVLCEGAARDAANVILQDSNFIRP